MTAFTTGFALIPLALKGGKPGNEIQSLIAASYSWWIAVYNLAKSGGDTVCVLATTES